jgi:hypothetical protein
MSELTRRGKAIPVQATPVPPETVVIPGSGPIPPQQPGVTQNIIYVNVPAGAAAPNSAPQPQEVHHHTTNIYEAPRRYRARLGTSFLGTLGLVLGGVSVGASYLPQLIWLAKPAAMAGAASALVGLTGAILFGRVGRAMPLLGLIASGIAYGLWLRASGQLPKNLPDIPKIDLSISTAPDAPTAAEPATVKPPTAAAVAPAQSAEAPPRNPALLHDNTIFGDGSTGWEKKTAPVTPTPVTPPPAAPPAAPPTPAAPMLDVATATENLENARIAAGEKMGLDYPAAKAAAADAESNYQDAKIAGSTDLVALSQQRLQSQSRLNIIIDQLRDDPKVAAAEQALRAAKKSN